MGKMSLDVTGFSPDDISLTVDNHMISVKGKRTNKLGDVFVVDRKFRIDKKTTVADGVTANFDDGILEVTVPKREILKTGGRPRSIPISVTSASSAASSDKKKDGSS